MKLLIVYSSEKAISQMNMNRYKNKRAEISSSQPPTQRVPGNNLVKITSEDQHKLISIIKNHTEATTSSMSPHRDIKSPMRENLNYKKFFTKQASYKKSPNLEESKSSQNIIHQQRSSISSRKLSSNNDNQLNSNIDGRYPSFS